MCDLFLLCKTLNTDPFLARKENFHHEQDIFEKILLSKMKATFLWLLENTEGSWPS